MALTVMFTDEEEASMRREFQKRCTDLKNSTVGVTVLRKLYPADTTIPLLVIGELSERYQLGFDAMARILFKLP